LVSLPAALMLLLMRRPQTAPGAISGHVAVGE